MNDRHTTIRSMHDLGAAVWMGGSLMGAVGLNGASQDAADATERTQIASRGWARWAPVSAAAIATHLVGGLGLLIANRGRVAGQSGVTANTVIKTAVTVAALSATAYSGLLGARIARAGRVPSEGGSVPAWNTPEHVAVALKQQRLLQWAIPALTGTMIAMGSQQGEQQRPRQMWDGVTDRLTGVLGR
ncbi:hypothetical protein [Actinoplanes rectilineatus]|uniref:hypothetical protein n=1 Tax=Actinoplanes rectilineatus TaxID=113571 RepID=UPI0005F287B5|nr:hypothetical protein [Actinoplanes rectilineatus]